MRLKSLAMCWILAVHQACAFSPDQCSTDTDCPSDKTCILEGDVLLCRTESAQTPNSDEPDASDVQADKTNSSVTDVCGSTCATDIFEPNDSINRAAPFTEDILGCRSFTFQTFDLSSPATICDDEDWYHLDIKPCDDRSYLLEIEVNLSSQCSLDTWTVLGDWDCQSPQISCSETEFGRRARFLIRAEDERRWAEGLQFGIKANSAHTDYILRVTVIP